MSLLTPAVLRFVNGNETDMIALTPQNGDSSILVAPNDSKQVVLVTLEFQKIPETTRDRLRSRYGSGVGRVSVHLKDSDGKYQSTPSDVVFADRGNDQLVDEIKSRIDRR